MICADYIACVFVLISRPDTRLGSLRQHYVASPWMPDETAYDPDDLEASWETETIFVRECYSGPSPNAIARSAHTTLYAHHCTLCSLNSRSAHTALYAYRSLRTRHCTLVHPPHCVRARLYALVRRCAPSTGR